MPAIPNLMLASLPRKVYQAIVPGLTPVTLAFGDMIHEQDRAVAHVYFPGSCLVSLLLVVDQHMAIEVGLVGPEGMVGIPSALGAAVSPVQALVQGEGSALRMSRAGLAAALLEHPPLRRALDGYTHGLMGQIAQTAACNRFHKLNARLARRLLMTRDRLGTARFRVTQEFLSAMLGVRRVSVSEAASAFQRAGLIGYSRGVITVLDHEGLEAACCSCYGLDAARAGGVASWRPVSPASYEPNTSRAARVSGST